MEKKLLKTEDVCAMLSISGTTLWRLVKSGKFPKAINMGERSLNFYKREWVDDFINSLESNDKVVVGLDLKLGDARKS